MFIFFISSKIFYGRFSRITLKSFIFTYLTLLSNNIYIINFFIITKNTKSNPAETKLSMFYISFRDELSLFINEDYMNN
jgi:hypothetical protein